MKLAAVIQAFIEQENWDDTVDIDETTGDSTLHTGFEIRNQIFDLYLEGDESSEFLSVFLYAPFRIIEGKSVDAIMLVNFINDRYRYRGRLCITDSGQIRYREVIDTENLEASPAMIDNMLSSAYALFDLHTEALGAVALTRKTYEAIRAEYDRKYEQDMARKKGREEGEC